MRTLKKMLSPNKAKPKRAVPHVRGDEAFLHGSWYRGRDANFLPTRKKLRAKNGIRNYVLNGWLPEKPFVTKQTPITAFGSCFAAHVTSYLSKRGYNVLTAREGGRQDFSVRSSYIVRFGEGMVNSAVILQQFQWAFEDRKFDEELWFDKNKSLVEYDDEVRRTTRDIFEKSELFIITLGLSEVWYNKLSGDVFWRAIPADKFDETKHGFKVLTTQENKENISEIYRMIRKYRGPDVSVLFTLSPIPLAATFRPVSCVTANSVSKASLRVAVDEVVRENEDDQKLHYFPSYEIIQDCYKDPFDEDFRHPKKKVIRKVMRHFARTYCVDGWTPRTGEAHVSRSQGD